MAITAVLAIAAASAPAFADENDSKVAAKAKLETGADLLVTHAYARALAEFEDAYRLFPSPKIFFDIGLANAGLARNPDALRAFQRFLIEATDAGPDTVARAKAQIQALLPHVAIVDIVCRQAGMEILVDNRSVGRAPLAGPLYLDPGSHQVVAKASESAPPIVKAFDVVGGARVSIDVLAASTMAIPTLPPPPVAAATPPAGAQPGPIDARGSAETDSSGERPLYKRPWFWAAAAGAVAAVGVTLLLTVGRSTNDPTPSLGRMALPVSP